VKAAGLTALVLAWALLVAAPSAVQAGTFEPNRLRNPAVTPMSGTTATVFTFTVRYQSFADDPAVGVTASVPGLTLPMALTGGSAVNGTWTTTASLPAGAWTVTYAANAQQYNDPTRTVGTVQVVPLPTPTPIPTPVPTPVPTPPPPPPPPPQPPAPPAPAPVVPVPPAPTPVPPAPTPAPSGAAPTPAGSASPSASPMPAVVVLTDLDIPFPTILGIAMAAVLTVVGGWWIIAAGRRRHEEDESPPIPATAAVASVRRTAGASPAPSPPPSVRRRPPAEWEVAKVLDDEPIGTVDFTGDELPPEFEASLDQASEPLEPGNPRTRRMQAMHTWRDEEVRGSLLHRMGLPEVDED
jgi:hypothetical protein